MEKPTYSQSNLGESVPALRMRGENLKHRAQKSEEGKLHIIRLMKSICTMGRVQFETVPEKMEHAGLSEMMQNTERIF